MQSKNKFRLLTIGLIFLVTLSSFTLIGGHHDIEPKEGRKIVNIVNCIRLLEPRDARITQDVLYQTVVSQVEIMKNINCQVLFCFNMMP